MKWGAAALAAGILSISGHAATGGVCSVYPGPIAAAWSPDGAVLATSLHGTGCPNTHAWVTDANGTRFLHPDVGWNFQGFSWAPTGRKLAVSLALAPAELFVYDLATGSRTRVAEGTYPAWSPDGDLIAFSSTDYVHAAAPDGSGRRRLARGYDPAWSPDSMRIAFVSSGSIHVVRADGSGERRVTAGHAVRWVPDGSRLAVLRGDTTYLVDPDTGAERVLARGRIVQVPDAESALMLDRRGGLRLVSLRTGGSRLLAEDVAAAALHPQGERLALVLDQKSAGEIYVAERTGSRPTRIWPPRCRPRNTPACFPGTDGADRIVGSWSRDVIIPGGGDDRVWGLDGPDVIKTSFGRDLVYAGPGRDYVATRGNRDRVYGGPGDDVLWPGGGEDVVEGGPGRDWIDARDERADTIRCGPRYDIVYADPADRLARDCERRYALDPSAVRAAR